MDPTVDRLFLFLDEWIWVALLLFIANRWTERMGIDNARSTERRYWKWAFWVVLGVGATMIYGIGYPMHWKITGQRFPW